MCQFEDPRSTLGGLLALDRLDLSLAFGPRERRHDELSHQLPFGLPIGFREKLDPCANTFGHVQIDAFHSVMLGNLIEDVNKDTNEDAFADGERGGNSMDARLRGQSLTLTLSSLSEHQERPTLGGFFEGLT